MSNYYHILKNNPWKSSDPFYADYNQISKEDGLSHALNVTLDDYISWVGGWKMVARDRQDINCMLLKYEDLLDNPVDIFKDILLYFNINLNDRQINTTILESSGKLRKSYAISLMPGEKSTKRKGVIGEWKRELNKNQKELFRKKAGLLLIELGYEDNLNW